MSANHELADQLAQVLLFSRCSRGALRSIARHAQVVTLPAGSVVVAEDEAGDALVVVLDGCAVVRDGEVKVDEVGAGGSFGELAIFDGQCATTTVVARSDVRIAVIGRRSFRALVREYGDIAEQLLTTFAGELRDARYVPHEG